MAIEFDGMPFEEPQDRRPETSGSPGSGRFEFQRVSHFPIDEDTATAVVNAEVSLLNAEGPKDYLSHSSHELQRTNPELRDTVQSRRAHLDKNVGSNASMSYELGAVMGYKVIEGQTDAPVPRVKHGTIIAASRDEVEDDLLAEIPFGKYTPRSGPDEAYLLALAKAAPDKETLPIENDLYWDGAKKMFHVVRGAEEVKTLEAIWRKKRRP